MKNEDVIMEVAVERVFGWDAPSQFLPYALTLLFGTMESWRGSFATDERG